jgi:DNA repair protein RadC
MSIKDLPTDAQPARKLLQPRRRQPGRCRAAGAAAAHRHAGQGVLQLAEGVLARMGGYAGLLQAGADDLKGIKGLGPAKRAELAAVVEMARRALAQRWRDAPVFDSPQMVKDYLQLHLGAPQHEVFAVLFLDSQHRLISLDNCSRGTLSQTSVYPREVVKRALAPPCGRRGAGAQPPQRHRGPAVADDEHLTQALKSRAGAGGRARARPPGGGLRPGGQLCRAGAAVNRSKFKSLADLAQVRDELQRRTREAAERQARALTAQREQQRRQQAQHGLFARAVGPVYPMRDRGLAELDLPRPAPHPRMREPTRPPRWPNRCRTRSTSNPCCSPTTG